jgi:hypothetical protein
MDTERSTGNKLREWVRRYLPCEIAGTTCEFGGAGIAYLLTGSFAAAAIVETVGASLGYYAAAYGAAVRTTYREHAHLPRKQRALTANRLALRSIAVEFGPAEMMDSLIVRPLPFYLGPILFCSVAWSPAGSSPSWSPTSASTSSPSAATNDSRGWWRSAPPHPMRCRLDPQRRSLPSDCPWGPRFG